MTFYDYLVSFSSPNSSPRALRVSSINLVPGNCPFRLDACILRMRRAMILTVTGASKMIILCAPMVAPSNYIYYT